MSARTSSSTIFFGDDTTEVRAKTGKAAARNPNATVASHIFGGAEEPEEVKLTTRIREPGGTGGRSTLFDPDPVQAPSQRSVQPNPLTEPPEELIRLSTKPLQPGGTGGKSSVFHDDDDNEPAAALAAPAKGQRNPSPFATDDATAEEAEPVRTSAKILRPGGMGGVSNVFITDSPPPPPAPTQQLGVSSPTSDTGSASGEENKKYTAKRFGGGPSQVFASTEPEEEENHTWSGRKVEAGRTNMSQVALGGGYPDSEPQNRTARRGNIRADYNQSQIMFGDDTGGAPVQDRSNRTSSRVLRPGGTGGGSQIAFGDDTGGEPVSERKAGTSTKILRPGGLGGTSQITFGDDSGSGPAVTASRVNRPGGTGGTSQINFAHDNPPEPTGPTKTSSRVLRPGGTGGASQITF